MNKLDLEDTTRRFHNVYEKVAKEYGYKTREDTKELDFNSPNGMTMLKTVETITTPYLEEIERLKQQHEAIKKYVHNHTITYIDNGIECCKPDEYFNISCVEDMLNGNFENLDVLFEDSEDNE